MASSSLGLAVNVKVVVASPHHYVLSKFENRLQSFVRLYAFLAQIVPFSDVDLERLYVYGQMLLRKLPDDGEERDEVYERLEGGEAVGRSLRRPVSAGTVSLEAPLWSGMLERRLPARGFFAAQKPNHGGVSTYLPI